MAPKRKSVPKAEDEETAMSKLEGIEKMDPAKCEEGTRILCKYSPNVYYEAVIKSIKVDKDVKTFTVHYQGWNSRWDKEFTEEDAKDLFLEYTEENAKLAKESIKEEKNKTKKPKKSTGTPNAADRSGDVSRSSTPATRGTPRAGSAVRDSVGPTPKRRGGAQPQTSEAIREPPRKDLPAIIFTPALRSVLIDDHDYVTNKQKLVKLPARFTVAKIVEEYINSLNNNEDQKGDQSYDAIMTEYNNGATVINPTKQTLRESAYGLLDYFDSTLGSLLLYKFERPQYSDEYAKHSEVEVKEQEQLLPQQRDFRMSDHYGFVHFLRMFVRLGEILSYAPWTPRAMETIMRHAQDFIVFLSKKREDFYEPEKDYYEPDKDYAKRAFIEHA